MPPRKKMRPRQVTNRRTLVGLYRALEQIESGSVTFPAGGQRKSVNNLKRRIAELESRGVTLPDDQSHQKIEREAA